jgi:hypothetical protein
VVGMVMGGKNMRELAPELLEFGFHGIGVGCVDRGGGASLGIVNDDTVVVGQTHELTHIEMGHEFINLK